MIKVIPFGTSIRRIDPATLKANHRRRELAALREAIRTQLTGN